MLLIPELMIKIIENRANSTIITKKHIHTHTNEDNIQPDCNWICITSKQYSFHKLIQDLCSVLKFGNKRHVFEKQIPNRINSRYRARALTRAIRPRFLFSTSKSVLQKFLCVSWMPKFYVIEEHINNSNANNKNTHIACVVLEKIFGLPRKEFLRLVFVVV